MTCRDLSKNVVMTHIATREPCRFGRATPTRNAKSTNTGFFEQGRIDGEITVFFGILIMPKYDDHRLLNRSEVEEHFGIPKRFLETAAARGEGPPLVRIGRLVRYRVSDICAWLSSVREVPKASP